MCLDDEGCEWVGSLGVKTCRYTQSQSFSAHQLGGEIGHAWGTPEGHVKSRKQIGNCVEHLAHLCGLHHRMW